MSVLSDSPFEPGTHEPGTQEIVHTSRTQFDAAIAQLGFSFDPAQTAAIAALTRPSSHGFYLWGGVGRGKTLIADTYFAAIDTGRKRRFHFHHFFRDLQAQIVRERVPIEDSLRRLIGDARVILFDEFHVHDVADGVYLTKALTTLLELDIFLIATSNYAPAELMPNPFFHERFRPAINLIQSELDVVHLGDGEDYRVTQPAVREGFGAGTWRVSREGRAGLDASPGAVAPDFACVVSNTVLDAEGHALRAVSAKDGSAEFTFDELCARPLGVGQFLWLSEHFRELALTNVPDLASVDRDPLARFTNLIDVLHDRGTRLHICAAGTPDGLLEAQDPPRDVARTVSRLTLLERM